MKTKATTEKKKQAAFEIAKIMYGSLQELPASERESRIRAIQKIKVNRKQNGKTPKHASTRRNLRERSRVATAR